MLGQSIVTKYYGIPVVDNCSHKEHAHPKTNWFFQPAALVVSQLVIVRVLARCFMGMGGPQAIRKRRRLNLFSVWSHPHTEERWTVDVIAHFLGCTDCGVRSASTVVAYLASL